MRSVPTFLTGAFTGALVFGMDEVLEGLAASDVSRQERAEKLFMLLPRLLFHRPLPRWFGQEDQTPGTFCAICFRSVGQFVGGECQRSRGGVRFERDASWSDGSPWWWACCRLCGILQPNFYFLVVDEIGEAHHIQQVPFCSALLSTPLWWQPTKDQNTSLLTLTICTPRVRIQLASAKPTVHWERNSHANISIHDGKTKVWNSGGLEVACCPEGCTRGG